MCFRRPRLESQKLVAFRNVKAFPVRRQSIVADQNRVTKDKWLVSVWTVYILNSQTQTQNILFNSNNHICKYKVKTETPLGLFAFYSWKIFINVMQDLWE